MRIFSSTIILFFLLPDLSNVNGSGNNILLYKLQQEQRTGTLYIQRLPTSEHFFEAPGQENNKYYNNHLSKQNYNAYIEITGVKKIKITQQRPEVINGLNPTRKYLLKIYSADGKKQMTSFYFSFESYGSKKLRLIYDPFYSSWRFD